ncbi:MAG: alpha/beta fold hydrolase [Thermaerobacter sp.]|nr:alpha/beta fold hydrolase [Thermaerobacter sp.]
MFALEKNKATLIGVSLLLAGLLGGCSANTAPSEASPHSVGPNGRLASMTTLSQSAYGVPGLNIYSLKYWSRGHLIQEYLDIPSGKGPFPILVFLHGGWMGAMPLHHVNRVQGVLTSATLPLAAQWASYKMIVVLPNFAGYGPSGGAVSTPRQNALDALNGLSALQQICGLHVKADETYLLGGSMGGAVAIYMAERASDIRAAVLISPGLNTLWGTKFRVDLPVLFLAGRQDTVFPPGIEEMSYDVLRSHDGKSVAFSFEPGGHFPLSQSWGDMIAWFGRHGLPFGLLQESTTAPHIRMCTAQ